MLPEAMPFERAFLGVIYTCDADGVAPTQAIVSDRLEFEWRDVKKRVAEVMEQRTVDPDIRGHSFVLKDWLKHRRILIAAAKAVEELHKPEGTIEQRFAKFLNIASEAAPQARNMEDLSMPEGIKVWEREQVARVIRVESGLNPGPNFPWKNLNDLVPALKLGEMTTFSAQTKHGKSMMAAKIAEHMAYDERQQYYVLFVRMEQNTVSAMDRVIARNLPVMTDVLRTGKVDPRIEPWKSRIEQIVSFYATLEEHRGRLRDIYAPGMTPSRLKATVMKHQAIADSIDKELVLVLDYTQTLDSSELASDPVAGLNMVADFLKTLAEAAGIYIVTFAQMNMSAGYDRVTSYGGSLQAFRSQVLIQLIRGEEAEVDLPMKGKDGKQKIDMTGRPMYYHRRGQLHSDGILRVMRANDDASGSAAIRFVNGYFEIENNEEKAKTEVYAQRNLT